jgi:hypothetical protein
MPIRALADRTRFWLQDATSYAAAWTSGLPRLDQIDADIAALADIQIAHWGTQTLTRNGLDAAFDALNARHHQVFILDIAGPRVTIRPKTPVLETPLAAAQMPDFIARARRYRMLIAFVIRAFRLDIHTTIALDVNDQPLAGTSLPLFAFQNTPATNAILLPDVDFFGWSWYRGMTDRLAYDDKAIRAVFAGSSSGQMHDIADIERPTNPRLVAAARFTGHPNIDVRISRAVQCTPEAKALLERQPYFKPELGWSAQWQNRFILSIDGNGATCSRVALALKSNCALIKYASPFHLYYFDRLTPGRDYLAVTSEREIEDIVEAELSRPGHHRDIAHAGAAFFRRFLDRAPVLAYTAALLKRYDALTTG